MATGGTIARRLVLQKRPQLIIAVACEGNLTSGSQDTYPVPVHGVVNQRPYGSCCTPGLPLAEVGVAVDQFWGTAQL